MLVKAQIPTMLDLYDMIADYLLDNALFFFRDRIEKAYKSRNYAGYANGERVKRGKNDTIFERLDFQFSFEQAMQNAVMVKGADVTHNSIKQMLKNWKNQRLIEQTEDGKFKKLRNG